MRGSRKKKQSWVLADFLMLHLSPLLQGKDMATPQLTCHVCIQAQILVPFSSEQGLSPHTITSQANLSPQLTLFHLI